ncbi:DUF992 domain-containing protein [Aquabacter cavernae]|uniref:DUF992 domain-containing protein n=1 Tax=Aquabacter cavernae TaxID=2496029 RepID=UPI000F8E4774|nr:DUF992 domain-containing protein [Aquabacter cavernae]
MIHSLLGAARFGARRCVALLVACVPAAAGAQETPKGEAPKVQAGLLECRGAAAIAYGFGSTRSVTCEFRPAAEMGQFFYTGTLERAGIDFGVSDQGSMLWIVLATSPNIGPQALAGQYVGLSTGVALGPGFSANLLVAKDASRGISLQPMSISADSGLSVSLAGVTLTLTPSQKR